MFKHLLIATDGSELAGKAVAQGASLARALGAKVTIATVTEAWHDFVSSEVAVVFPPDDYDKAVAESAASVLDAATKIARQTGLAGDQIMVLHVQKQFPAEGIIEAAREKSADLIVMASHGRRGVTRLLLGSQANRVVTHSTIPVLICR